MQRTAAIVQVWYQDREGSRAPTVLYYPANSDETALLRWAWSCTAFQPVSECPVDGIDLVLEAMNETITAPTTRSLDAGVLVFTTASGGYGSLVIPGILPSLLRNDGCWSGRQLDIAQAAIQALAEEATGEFGCVSPAGDVFTDLHSGHAAQLWTPLRRQTG